MENIAHTLCGLRLADLGFREDLKKAAPWVGVAAANLPDLDSVTMFFSQELYLTQHRGLTHSFFGWPFLALLGALVSHRISGASTYARHLQLWCLGLISHQVLDWITAWGTLLLWPIQTRFALDSTFIVDPVFWFILGGLPYLWRRYQWTAPRIGRTSLLLFSAWILLCMMLRQQAQSYAPKDSQVFAAPLAPLFWTGIHREGATLHRYWLTPWSGEEAGVFEAPSEQQKEALRQQPLADAILRMENALVFEVTARREGEVKLKLWDLAFTSWLDPTRAVIGGEFWIVDAPR
jgi:membrane-bound metal-dependent hydrolase YbcI (DUF457 family)